MEEGVERLARHPLDHGAEHVGGNRVIPALAGREFERQLADCSNEAVQIEIAVPALHLRLAIGGIDVGAVLEAIGEPRGVPQKVEHPHRFAGRPGDERHAATAAVIDAHALELGQYVMDRRVDRDLALFDQHHERDRGDRLGHAGDAEQRSFVDTGAALAGSALMREMHDLAIAGDQQLGIGQPSGVEVARLQKRVDRRQPVDIEARFARFGGRHPLPYPSF